MSADSQVAVGTAPQPEQMQSATTQWAYRSQKVTGLRSGSPIFDAVEGFSYSEGCPRTLAYSPDGSILAVALEASVRLVDTREAATASVLHDLPAGKVVALQFSPKGSFLSTWERPTKNEDGSNVKNLKIWNTKTAELLSSFERKTLEGCFFQFTSAEAHCVRQVSTELQIFDTKNLAEGAVIGRLRLEGMTSFEVGPGNRPSVAVFCGEKKSAPASLRVYSLASCIPAPENPPAPLSQKSFFKADKIQLKWNQAGSGLLFMTSTDVDKTGKSYYGESNLYMMSARGDFDCRVGLDKEGPIHDFEWNPDSREFVVIYGFMPAKAILFTDRVKVIAELGTAPRNFVSFNPQGRLFVIAGFGNLSGTVDVWDRQKIQRGTGEGAAASGKLCTMDANNSSVCQWSPDGHFILTGTLSPRLRVENGVKIWHCTGKLIHIDMIDELFQASWRPSLNASLVTFPDTIPPAPSPSSAASAFLATKPVRDVSKPSGAYRPPGARGLPAPDIFRREDGSSSPAPGASSGGRRSVPGAPPPSNGNANGNSRGAGRRTVPGAPGGGGGGGGAAPGGGAKEQRRGAEGKKGAKGSARGAGPAAAAAEPVAVVEETPPVELVAGAADVGGDPAALIPEKRLRNLNKKLKAIGELKDKRDRGEKLEMTQLAKIEAEGEIRREIASLE